MTRLMEFISRTNHELDHFETIFNSKKLPTSSELMKFTKLINETDQILRQEIDQMSHDIKIDPFAKKVDKALQLLETQEKSITKEESSIGNLMQALAGALSHLKKDLAQAIRVERATIKRKEKGQEIR